LTVASALIVLGFGRALGSMLPEVVVAMAIDVVAGFALVTLLACAWYAFGREVVTASPSDLTIDHNVLLLRFRRRNYAAKSVTNLRAVPPGQVVWRGRLVRAVAALAFDCEGQCVRFGAGVVGSAAEQVIHALRGGLIPQGG
jgi:uncharacterized membrane protein